MFTLRGILFHTATIYDLFVPGVPEGDSVFFGSDFFSDVDSFFEEFPPL